MEPRVASPLNVLVWVLPVLLYCSSILATSPPWTVHVFIDFVFTDIADHNPGLACLCLQELLPRAAFESFLTGLDPFYVACFREESRRGATDPSLASQRLIVVGPDGSCVRLRHDYALRLARDSVAFPMGVLYLLMCLFPLLATYLGVGTVASAYGWMRRRNELVCTETLRRR